MSDDRNPGHIPHDMTDSNDTQGDMTERVERTDVGVSITAELKRGTGTRDQDKLVAKVKAATREEAVEEMEAVKPKLREWAADLRAIQPGEDDE